MENDKKPRHHHKWEQKVEDMGEFEKYMAMSWGSPEGLASIFIPLSVLILSISVFIMSIGGFLWLLHVANIIK